MVASVSFNASLLLALASTVETNNLLCGDKNGRARQKERYSEKEENEFF
jgi:hypothetical protein